MRKLKIDPPITNACGILSYVDVFKRMEESLTYTPNSVGAWVIKSIGPMEKSGNENPTYIDGGMNSFALPCPSHDAIEDELKAVKLKKPLIGSCYGSKPKDYSKTIKRFDKYFCAWELNVSCPNSVPGEKSVMKSMCNVRKGVELASAARKVTEKPIIAKLSPNEDYVRIARAIADHVDYINCGNTIGPGLEIDYLTGYPVLAGKFGGLSGEHARPIIQRMVHETYQAVGDKVGIVAAGGISEPEHIISYARLGASIFQIGTAFEKYKTIFHKANFIEKINYGIEHILKEMHVSRIDDIIGENHV